MSIYTSISSNAYLDPIVQVKMKRSLNRKSSTSWLESRLPHLWIPLTLGDS